METSCENRPHICSGQTGASLKQDNSLFTHVSVYAHIPQLTQNTSPSNYNPHKPPWTVESENRNAGAGGKKKIKKNLLERKTTNGHAWTEGVKGGAVQLERNNSFHYLMALHR